MDPVRSLLDPGVAQFIDEVERRLGPATHGAGPAERRLRMERLARAFAVERPAGLMVEDWWIASAGREIPVRIYRPPGARPKPGLIFFHGGGWVLGSLDSHDGFAAALSAGSGCVVVSVHYRRAPENPHPAPLDDCAEALHWVRAEARFLNIDETRLGLIGDSAGAHLAIACALRAATSDLRPALLALLYPAIEPRFDTPSYMEFANGPVLTRPDMEFFWSAFLDGRLETRDPEAIPALSPDLARLPPTFIVTAEIDPLRDEGESFAAKLRESGVAVSSRRAEGLVHGFFRAAAFSSRVRDEFSQLIEFVQAL